MTTPFGPQLVGETEKTLNALLRRHLDAAGVPGGLSEPQWVTMRLADALDGAIDDAGLAAAVADRAHFPDAAELVDGLRLRGLVADGRLTTAGQELLTRLQASIADDTATVFADLADDDIAATERVLNQLVSRARAVLAG
jgi:hypothetical protein